MKSRCAAIIVEYRSAARTIACVASLAGQGLEEIVIVDNSDDGRLTFDALARGLGHDPRVTLLDAGGNLGFAAGINRGLARLPVGHGRVLVINNDAVAPSGLVARLSTALDAAPEACIAFPALVHAGAPLGEIHYHRWFALLLSRPWPGTFCVPRGCCMLVDRQRLPRERLFDEDFFMYGEEIQLGWSLRDRPGALVFVGDCEVTHEGSAAAGMGSPFYEERTALAHVLLTSKLANGNRLLLIALFVARHGSLLARALLRSLRARSGLPVMAYANACALARRGSTGLAGTTAKPPP
ncbi:glycosyltransferase family 2 protein [Marilutibacter spongiae]|uniref:Glycosyltransferase family 2 protein n=1 Tax=Marilutibacter spongiae TaxID=2025720 RepID=A0A7W3Y4I0_9GAMM|nr:glycosyltransferase family 2 protein [Lysobacter spongiae]MBB1059132.1 glycosyltransferase family 2 protein [Lysobacter spongiae]